MADPDETCPGEWIELDIETGFCSLGDECRNPTRVAHQQPANEPIVIDTDDL